MIVMENVCKTYKVAKRNAGLRKPVERSFAGTLSRFARWTM